MTQILICSKMENLTLHALKSVKGFNLKRISFIVLISEDSFKLENVVLVIITKMLVIVFIFDY